MTCEHQIAQLIKQFESGFAIDESIDSNLWGDVCRIRTPFFLPDLTPIHLYIETSGEGTVLTDRGETSDHLFLIGASKSATNRFLSTIRERFGLLDLEDEIAVVIDSNNPRSSVAVATSAIQIFASRFSSMPSTRVASEFDEAIASFLAAADQSFQRNASAEGKTQKFHVDFLIDTGPYLQLPLWTFDPTQGGASRRARDLVFWTNDFREGQIREDKTLERPKILIKTGIHLSQNSSAQRALLAIEEYISSDLIHWDMRITRHEMSEILRS